MRRPHAAIIAPAATLMASVAAHAQCAPTLDRFPDDAGVNNEVHELVDFDIGQGRQLGLTGVFTSCGGVTTRRVAVFDGAVFDNLAAGVTSGYGGSGYGRALAEFQSYLFLGGNMDQVGGVYADNLCYWNGSSWYYVGNERYVVTLVVMPSLGANGTLFAGNDVGKWESWDGAVRTIGALPQLLNGEIEDAIVHNDGAGEAIYAVGSFRNSDGSPMRRFARWKPGDSGWTQVGGGVGGGPGADVVYDIDVHEGVFYLAGTFATAGGQASGGIASWNGSGWTHYGLVEGYIRDIEWFDDGSGPALYAGGEFTAIDGVAAANLARWKDGAWQAVGAGANGIIRELHVADLGDGPALYIAGSFTMINGQASSRFAILRSCEAVVCPGDTNGDNIVDFQDLNTVVSAFNTTSQDSGYNASADFDGDGDVDFADLNIVLGSFNTAC